MRKAYKYLIGIAVLAALVGGYLGFGSANTSSSPNPASRPTASSGKVFVGVIKGGTLAPQTLTGLKALSDQGCATDPKTGLSNCTTSFATNSGTVYFNYEHDMMMQPCLGNGDLVDLTAYADGTATVTRTYYAGGMGA